MVDDLDNASVATLQSSYEAKEYQVVSSFRELPKHQLGVKVPPELRKAFKREALEAEMSDGELATRILSAHFGRDVADFGLDPSVELPQPSHSHA